VRLGNLALGGHGSFDPDLVLWMAVIPQLVHQRSDILLRTLQLRSLRQHGADRIDPGSIRLHAFGRELFDQNLAETVALGEATQNRDLFEMD
jgi:hypothetical protein